MDIKKYIKNISSQSYFQYVDQNKKIIILAVIVLLALIISPSRNFLKYNIWDSMHMSPEFFFKTGVKYEEIKYMKYAVGSFKRALRMEKGRFNLDPRNLYQLESLFNLGVIYYQHLKNYPRALYYFSNYMEIFEKLGVKNPHEKDILDVINYILSIDDSTKNARAKALKKKGTRAYFEKDYQSASEYFQQALTLDPSYVEAYINLATTYLQMGDFKNAVEYWKICLLFNPEEKLDIFINLALAYEHRIKNYEEAANYYEKFVESAQASDQRINVAKMKIQELKEASSK